MSPLSEQEIQVIEKFGFRINGEKVVHKKMGLEKEISGFAGFSSIEELESFVKGLLRTA
ncbi:hypothetical protein [Ammoniphilus sp. CFH 90114]|uniref:hypothetical protein n=1 Tax=Ammoniphilus sp. CFH 90114 TaxID=2493665 RepID=UPI0013E940D9|nr:hypothetical protein [Ammoniphilus sp. CFH 90114]